MAQAEKVRIALIKRGMQVTELAKILGCTPQNISMKLKRDNFSEKELVEIAGALNCTFEGCFVMNDTGERI